jgi:hypothetical protein
VVGDRDDVVAASSKQVHDLPKRQRAVRVGGVDVKVAKQHLCPPEKLSAEDEKSLRVFGIRLRKAYVKLV